MFLVYKIIGYRSITGEHPQALMGHKFRADRGNYFFTQHVIKTWNSLPQNVAMAARLNVLKWD